jgi:hypothetical protein
VQKAVVSVKGWHTGVFTPQMLKSSPEIFGFLKQNVLKEAARFFPAESAARGERAADENSGAAELADRGAVSLAERGIAQGERGVDAIISFRAMLLDLLDKIEDEPELHEERHAAGDAAS